MIKFPHLIDQPVEQPLPAPAGNAGWPSAWQVVPVGTDVGAVRSSSNLTVIRPESFSFQQIEKFFFKKNILDKPASLETPASSRDWAWADPASQTVESPVRQFNDAISDSLLFASDGAPESVPDRADDMRSLLQPHGWSKPRLMV